MPPCAGMRWQDRAVCASVWTWFPETIDWWFPTVDDEGKTVRGPTLYNNARKLCAICPVSVECLEAAEENDEKYGMWAGLSPSERDHRRRAKLRVA